VLYAMAVFLLGGLLPGLALALLSLVLPASTGPLIAVALLMPYMFFFAATLHISDYVSYRDVFHAGETLAPLTPGSRVA